MLLRSIKYHNFRPFIGDQEINLLIDPEKNDANVIVILGDNTFGKSTVVLSFIWCLYGESRFSRPNDILNKKVEAALPDDNKTKEVASVVVEFEDDGKVYTMKRSQEFVKKNGVLNSSESVAELTYVTLKGETMKIGPFQNDINVAIKSILPLDLSTFFFFEGEKTNDITKKDLGSAVRTLLGLEAFERMRAHLYGSQTQNVPYSKSVMGDYLNKQNDESGELAQREWEKKQAAENAWYAAEKRIKELEEQIVYYNTSIENINEKLRKAGPSKELQKRRDQIAREVEEIEKDIEKKSKSLLALFSKESLPLFLMPLLEPASSKLMKMRVSDKGIKGIEAKAIHELLHRGECLCGTDLREGTLPYKNVAKYIEYVPPRSLGTLVRDMSESIEEVNERTDDFISKFDEIYRELALKRDRLNKLEKEDKAKLEEIKKIGVIDTEDEENNLEYYKKKLNELRDDRDDQKELSTRKKSEAETALNIFNTLKAKNEKAKKFHRYYLYAEALYKWVNSNYTKKEDELRGRLNTYITELFNSMYSGKREINIDRKYNIVMTVDGKVVDDTGGLRVIQYFAYVGGLVKLAYEIMQERDVDDDGNKQSLGEQYPLVLDAAFSHADEQHTCNISRELSNAVGQLVFAVMKKDWVHAKKGLVGRVGRMYELIKVDETEVKIVEV